MIVAPNQGIVIQARSGSTRMKNKMLKPFYQGKSILELLIERLKKNFDHSKIVVATTTNLNDEAIVKLAERLEINCFKGSESNVLVRFLDAANNYDFDKIVRVCADNPFLDIEGVGKLIESMIDFHSDYHCFCTSAGIPTIKTHYGFWAEGIEVSALERVGQMATQPEDLEHVTKYIYEHPELFDIRCIPINSDVELLKSLRLTVDTENDFKIAQEIFKKVAIGHDSLLHTEKIIELVQSKKEWLDKMNTEINRNKK